MSLVSKIQQIRDVLTGIETLSAFHYRKPASVTAPYAIWQEDSEGISHHSDNMKSEQVIEVYIDYFTLTEYDSMVDSIQDALNDAQIAWRLESVQYEDETKLTHYEWVCEVI